MPQMDIDKLNRLYSDAEESGREIFAEMRSNVRLVAGDHFSRMSNKLWNTVRQTSRTSFHDKKLRITKNWMHYVQRKYKTAILSEAPGVKVLPAHETDLQSKKDADLNQAVWEDYKRKHKFKKKLQELVTEFVTVGEVCRKIFWDPNVGDLVGYQQKLDESGEPEFDIVRDPETNEAQEIPVPDMESPVFTGDFVAEKVYGFNLMLEAGTEEIDDKYRAWIIRKMMDTKELKEKYKDDEKKLAGILESAKETYIVFDVNRGSYQKKRDQTLVREFYWRPSERYPEGYYVYATNTVILEEGPLPFGIFPIVWAGFDTHPTSPRGRSIIKQGRPFNAELNRANSAMATAQVTLGEDKILYANGSKLAPGALLPGVRGISYSGGQPPIILPGRSGAQYLDYVAKNESELKELLMLDSMNVYDKSGQLDPYALLFKSASQKREYSPYIQGFESFLVDYCEMVLRLGRHYLPDDVLISAIGKREAINIQEYRDTTPLSYSVQLEPGSETSETLIGRQLTYQHFLQYVGGQLDPKTIGKVMRNMPYANKDDTLDELTIDDENAENEMLALERGEQVMANPHTDPGYMLRRLSHRVKKPDYKFLPPPVQAGYDNLISQYEQIVQAEAEAQKAAQNEFIPVDGALVTCDIYVEDPKNPENQAKRAKIPQRALEWLMDRMDQQGATLDKLEGMNAKSMMELAQALQQAPQQQPPGAGQPMGPPLGG